jgi:hypothetical protein
LVQVSCPLKKSNFKIKKSGLTQRALDAGESAAFSSIFLASSFLCSQIESTPAPAPVTQTVGHTKSDKKEKKMESNQLGAIFILKLVAVLGMLVAMIYGARGVLLRLKEKGQGFGPSSLQAIAITFFLPIVVILALLAGLESQALAALLGTVAGYVLSSQKKDD